MSDPVTPPHMTPKQQERFTLMETLGRDVPDSYLRHAVLATSQYDDVVASLSAEVLRLRAHLATLQAELEALRKELMTYEDQEAACCPEDVGFPEYIAVLTKRAEKAEAEVARLTAANADQSKRNTDETQSEKAAKEAVNHQHVQDDASPRASQTGSADEGRGRSMGEELVALRAQVADLTRDKWRDMETAPKDAKVLLWWEEEHGPETVAYWALGAWKEFGDGSKGWIGQSFHASENGYWTAILRPTHWMPLPAAPREEAKRG